MSNGPIIAFGTRRIEGRAAALVLLAILLPLLGWIFYKRPWEQNWPMWVSALGWVAFVMYWNAAARTASAAKKSETRQSRQVHQTLLNLGLLCLFLPIPGLRTRFLPAAAVLVPIGLGVQAAFFTLAVWARRHLGKHWSGEITIKVDHQLIRSGPYRVLRHPIYTAMLGMYLGTAIVSGQLHALAAVLMVVYAYARKIRLEEANLLEAFGVEYDGYCRGTWALLPGVF